MNQKYLKILEFNKIKNILSGYAISSIAKKMCQDLIPENKYEIIKKNHDILDEAVSFLLSNQFNPIEYFSDVNEEISFSKKGGVLSIKSLYEIAKILRLSRKISKSFFNDDIKYKNLNKIISAINLYPYLEQGLFDSISEDETLLDSASKELLSIRKQIKIYNDRIKSKLNEYLKNLEFKKYLQEEIVTIRNDRYVLPIKSEFRTKVQGIIHDQSSTGSTLFVEPISIVNYNNEIRKLISDEKIEITRILKSFSSEISIISDELISNINTLSELDFIFAKAAYSLDINATYPKINNDKIINLKNARHPLIDKNKVVPINISIGEKYKQLIITGPNTGGKTVSLKTLGLLLIMFQSGLQIPVDSTSEIAIFEDIFVDLGDEQSIEQSLSTFSSHMSNIVKILENSNENSLILLDELGAGTDPAEGAALAESILKFLMKCRSTVLATTHYNEIKAFAITTDGFENASMEFDIKTLSPTYVLNIGSPGRSNAFEISYKLGLPIHIIDNAKDLLSSNKIKFEDLLLHAEKYKEESKENLIQSKKDAEKAKQYLIEIEKSKKEIEEFNKIKINKAKIEAREILNKARIEAESLLSILKKDKKDLNVESLKKLINSTSNSIDDLYAFENVNTKLPKVDKINMGDIVYIIPLSKNGKVISNIDSKNEVLLQIGNIKSKFNINMLRQADNKKEKSNNFHKQMSVKLESVIQLNIDVRGMTSDEAILEIDNYLHHAYKSHYKEVSIIHGKGTGALRKAISQYLKTLRFIEQYRLGQYGEGEDGVTIVYLK